MSRPLKLLKDVPRNVVVHRLRTAADAMADALEHDDDEVAVQSALHRVFRDYVDAPAHDRLAAAVAALRPRKPVTTVALGLTGPAIAVPATRAFGGHRAP